MGDANDHLRQACQAADIKERMTLAFHVISYFPKTLERARKALLIILKGLKACNRDEIKTFLDLDPVPIIVRAIKSYHMDLGVLHFGLQILKILGSTFFELVSKRFLGSDGLTVCEEILKSGRFKYGRSSAILCLQWLRFFVTKQSSTTKFILDEAPGSIGVYVPTISCMLVWKNDADVQREGLLLLIAIASTKENVPVMKRVEEIDRIILECTARFMYNEFLAKTGLQLLKLLNPAKIRMNNKKGPVKKITDERREPLELIISPPEPEEKKSSRTTFSLRAVSHFLCRIIT